MNVLDAAVERMRVLLADGHRVVVCFSAGKDSGVAVEVCLMAMRAAGRGGEKLSVVMRDEEILYPGSFEYAERMARRPEIDFHWLVAHQPIVNVFNRASPYFWVMDPVLDPASWVRQPPVGLPRPVEHIAAANICAIADAVRFPSPPGKRTYKVMGLRVSESAWRTLGLHSKGGYVSRASENGVWSATPLYDWRDDDIWKAIADNRWDYNEAYDVLYRMGVPKLGLRIAPPTLNQASVALLSVGARAWPAWFDRVAARLPGVRTAAQFGRRVVQPSRRLGETWEACFQRVCLGPETPGWIRDRAAAWLAKKLVVHAQHAATRFPEVKGCFECRQLGSWRQAAFALYNGDPFCLKQSELSYVEPEFFRPGAGTWGGGAPTWGT